MSICTRCGSDEAEVVIGTFEVCPRCDDKPTPAKPAPPWTDKLFEFDDADFDDFWADEPTRPGWTGGSNTQPPVDPDPAPSACPHTDEYDTWSAAGYWQVWCNRCGKHLRNEKSITGRAPRGLVWP